MTLFQGDQLDNVTCLSLLRRASTGRVGVVIGPLAFIYPVRYHLSNGHIIFVVSIDQVATVIDDALVVLQADGYDEDQGSHWTVLAMGPATSVEPDTERVSELLRPQRHAFRLRPRIFSGQWLDRHSESA